MGKVGITSRADSQWITESRSTLAWDAREALDTRKVVDSHIIKTHRLFHTALGKSTTVTWIMSNHDPITMQSNWRKFLLNKMQLLDWLWYIDNRNSG